MSRERRIEVDAPYMANNARSAKSDSKRTRKSRGTVNEGDASKSEGTLRARRMAAPTIELIAVVKVIMIPAVTLSI